MYKKLLKFIDESPVASHAAANLKARLLEEGFEQLEFGNWKLKAGGKYFVLRNGSAIVAFRMPEKKAEGYVITAAHADSPCFRIHDHAEMVGEYVRLDVETYGSPAIPSWMNRPLSIAGRVMVRSPQGVDIRLVDFKKTVAMIPDMPMQLNKDVKEGRRIDLNRDQIAFCAMGTDKGYVNRTCAKLAGCKAEDIISTDLFLYCNEKGYVWGPHNEFISAPRFDDLGCAFGCMEGFLAAAPSNRVQVCAVYDHEEIGSRTKVGGGSNLLPNLLKNISAAMGLSEVEHFALLDNSWMISADNSHATHPNHGEINDFTESPKMNGGPAVKHSSKYATDGLSAALFKEVCHRAGVPVQDYSNRPDNKGGATVGSIATEEVSIPTIDIGMAQLAMHAALETQGAKDVQYLADACKASYESTVKITPEGYRF